MCWVSLPGGVVVLVVVEGQRDATQADLSLGFFFYGPLSLIYELWVVL